MKAGGLTAFVVLGAIAGAVGTITTVAIVKGIPELAFTPATTATLFSGIGGAVFGGLITLAATFYTTRQMLRRDTEERLAEEKTLALEVVLKVQQIANGYYTLLKQIHGGLSKLNPGDDLWQGVQSNAGSSVRAPMFEARELVPLLNADKAVLIDRVRQISLRYDAIETAFAAYGRRRLELQDFLAQYTTIGANGVATTTVKGAPANFGKLRAMELNNILRQILSFAHEDIKEANSLCSDVSEAFLQYFRGEKLFKVEARDLPAEWGAYSSS